MKRFTCPHCGFPKVLANRELRTYRKRLSGFTCISCGEKVSSDDLAKKRGKGPKPKGERRKRVKKEVIKETSMVVVQPYVEQLAWRTSDPPAPGEPRGYGVKAGWTPKPRQPTERTLEEVVVVEFLSNPKRKRKE